jgi:hypothetical protein
MRRHGCNVALDRGGAPDKACAVPRGPQKNFPAQGPGPHFELVEDGVIDFAPPAANEKISQGEIPPFEEADRERLETLLQLHGPFILSTAAGSELIAAEQQYQRRPAEEREYRVAAIDFATSLQDQPSIIEPSAAAFVLGAAEQISQGSSLERSGVAATSTLQNVAVVLAAAGAVSALPIAGTALAGIDGTIIGGVTAFLAGASLQKSKTFARVIAPLIAKFDQAAEVDFTKIRFFCVPSRSEPVAWHDLTASSIGWTRLWTG